MAVVACLVLFLSFGSAQVFKDGTFVEIPSGLSAQCGAVLNNTVSCSGLLSSVVNGYFPTESDLNLVCTTDCITSLQSLREDQLDKCTTSDTIVTGGLSYPPTLSLDLLIFTYNYTCLKDPSGNRTSATGYCGPTIDSWFNSSSTGYLTQAQNCSDCYLRTLQTQLNSDFGYSDELADDFASLTSSCGKPNYHTTSPTPYALPGNVSATATATPSATGSPCSNTYAIKPGDDCKSISKAQNVSTNSLLLHNGLAAFCAGFPEAGTELCLPPTCDVYTVQANDTCYGIAASFGYSFTATQVISWNPNINRGCSNLAQLAGYEICISNPGGSLGIQTTGSGINPTEATTTAAVPTDVVDGTNVKCSKYYHVSPGDTCSSVTVMEGISLQDFYFLNPEIDSSDCHNLFSGYSYCVRAVGNINTYSGYAGGAGYTPSCMVKGTIASSCIDPSPMTDTYWSGPYTASETSSTQTASSATSGYTPTSLPLAPGTSDNCSSYEEYLTPTRNRTINANSCYYVANFIGISPEQFVSYNPSLEYDPDEPAACVLEQGYRYCADPESSEPTGTTSSSASSITGASPTPTPTQSGMTSDCSSFYLVKSGDSCYDIANAAGISLDDFVQYNPAVKSDCSGLIPDYYVCIGKSTASASGTGPAKTTSGNGIATPTPTQDGMTTRCDSFHKVVSGDTCYDIANDNSISLQDFYAYNPSVHTDCSALVLGYYVCVGVVDESSPMTSNTPTATATDNGVTTPTPTQSGMAHDCTAFHQAVSGDGCYDIAQSAGISLDNFYAWNPDVGNDCAHLFLGYYYCIARKA